MSIGLQAKGASFVAMATDHNPRDIVVELVRKNPNGDRKSLFEQFREMLGECGEDYQRAVEYYFFVNMYDQLVRAPRISAGPMRQMVSRFRQREEIEAIKAQIVMLDLTMPNGKQMRECTVAEMAKFGNRYQKIAEKVGKAKLVGAVLSEDQVQAIMK